MPATTTLTKVAVIRRSDGTLYLNCRCGEPFEISREAFLDRTGEVVCTCGQRYNSRGYLLPSEVSE